MKAYEMQNTKALAFEWSSLILIHCHGETPFWPRLYNVRDGATAFSGKKRSFNEDRLGLFLLLLLLESDSAFWKEKAELSPKDKHIWKGERKKEQI